jgi:type I restriction enzyme S subunit
MGWDVENASDVFESFRYGTSTKCSEKQTSSDQLPVLRIPNVAAEQVNWNNLKYGEIPEAELDRLQLEAGDILFVRTNGNPDLIGRCAMFAGNREAVYASYLIRARLPKDSKTLPSFLHSLLCTDRFRSAIRQMATTSAGNYNINTKSLGSLPFILPPPDLQKQFVRLKNQVTERRTNLSNFASESDELFSSLQQRAFRGEL